MEALMRRILGTILFMIFLSLYACKTIPTKGNFLPETYANSKYRIEFAIGIKIYAIKITNYTNEVLYIDTARSAIISYDGEARNLKLLGGSSFIPPRSYVVYSSPEKAFYSTDIFSIFKKKKVEVFKIPDKTEMEKYIGKTIRLYLVLMSEDNEDILDIPLKLSQINGSPE
jgi:hypothetical protein